MNRFTYYWACDLAMYALAGAYVFALWLGWL